MKRLNGNNNHRLLLSFLHVSKQYVWTRKVEEKCQLTDSGTVKGCRETDPNEPLLLSVPVEPRINQPKVGTIDSGRDTYGLRGPVDAAALVRRQKTIVTQDRYRHIYKQSLPPYVCIIIEVSIKEYLPVPLH